VPISAMGDDPLVFFQKAQVEATEEERRGVPLGQVEGIRCENEGRG